jgi:hypothetical protein
MWPERSIPGKAARITLKVFSKVCWFFFFFFLVIYHFIAGCIKASAEAAEAAKRKGKDEGEEGKEESKEEEENPQRARFPNCTRSRSGRSFPFGNGRLC